MCEDGGFGHIAASDMNRLGIADRVAADRGGWSTTTTMRNVYQHSFSADREIAEEKVHEYYSEMLKNSLKTKVKLADMFPTTILTTSFRVIFLYKMI